MCGCAPASVRWPESHQRVQSVRERLSRVCTAGKRARAGAAGVCPLPYFQSGLQRLRQGWRGRAFAGVPADSLRDGGVFQVQGSLQGAAGGAWDGPESGQDEEFSLGFNPVGNFFGNLRHRQGLPEHLGALAGHLPAASAVHPSGHSHRLQVSVSFTVNVGKNQIKHPICNTISPFLDYHQDLFHGMDQRIVEKSFLFDPT